MIIQIVHTMSHISKNMDVNRLTSLEWGNNPLYIAFTAIRLMKKLIPHIVFYNIRKNVHAMFTPFLILSHKKRKID